MKLPGLNRLLVAWLAMVVFVASPAVALAAPENLLISVKFGKDLRAERRSSEPTRSRLYQTDDRRDLQQLRVLEGHKAYINFSRSVPYPVISADVGVHGAGRFYGMEYREMESGFEVSPRLENGRVLLDIRAQDERMSPRGGSIIDGSSVHTTVSGELGQWIQLSGNFGRATDTGSNTVRSTDRAAREDDTEIWVRVDRLD